MVKTKVMKFNELPFEKRNVINYYNCEAQILLLTQIIECYSDDVSPRLKRKLEKYRQNIRDGLDREYEQI